MHVEKLTFLPSCSRDEQRSILNVDGTKFPGILAPTGDWMKDGMIS